MKILFAILSLSLASSAYAENDPVLAHGQNLHDQKCTSCHNNQVYTREDRRVKSLNALSNQVNNCMKGPAKADWTVSETNSVIEYLNTKFYKF
ncbi:MAG: cytochrome c [Gammaproteobacteria bacterium]|nr:cytochrome c [Gammaproteobacteria bacterium]